MRLCSYVLIGLMLVSVAATAANPHEDPPKLQSATVLTFGPEGILFVADPQGAAIFAFRLGDPERVRERRPINVEGIDAKIAATLGTTTDRIRINDLAVQPKTGVVFVSVTRLTGTPQRGRGGVGTPVLASVDCNGKVTILDLDKIEYRTVALADAPQAGKKEDQPRRGRRGNRRRESITDLLYVQGRLYIAGLSNEEFASSLRSVPYPFKELEKGTSIEIYHGAHGKLETHSPIRTFAVFEMAGKPHLFAAYTCTPLVSIPLEDLKPGTHVKGKTIAELGNRNRPLDMVAYNKAGKHYLLIANSSRGVMKVPTGTFAEAQPVSARVERGKTAGVPYVTVDDWKQIYQLERFSDTHVVVLRRTDKGLNLETLPLP